MQLALSQVNVVDTCTFALSNSVAESVAYNDAFRQHLDMKDRKLLVSARCTTRKFYLHPPPAGRNDWHVRFTPPAIDGSRRVIFRSTGTKEIAAAKRIAAQIIESFWNDAGRGAEPLKLRNDNATIGELIDRYERNAVQRPRTIRGNIRSLRLMVKTLHKGDPDQKPTTVLTSSLIREFEKRRLRQAEKRATRPPVWRKFNELGIRLRVFCVRRDRLSRCGR